MKRLPHPTAPAPWGLLPALIAGAAVIYLVATVTVKWLIIPVQLRSGRGDFGYYLDAAAALSAGHDPYAAILRPCGHPACLDGYSYPPLLAELLRPLAALSPITAYRAWLLLSVALYLGGVALILRGLRGRLSGLALASLLALALLSFPLAKSLDELQIGPFLFLLTAIAAADLLRGGRGALAGGALAVAGVIRITPALAVAGLVRTRDPLRLLPGLVGFAATGLALTALTALLAGGPLVEYATRVLPRVLGGWGSPENLAIGGVLMRAELARTGGLVPGLGVVATVLSLAFLAVTWWRVGRLPPGGDPLRGPALGLGAFVAVLPLASGITEQHHLLLDWIPLALVVAAVRPGRAWWLALAGWGLIQVNHTRMLDLAQGWDLLRPAPGPLLAGLVLTSVPLIGALLLWLGAMAALPVTAERPGSGSRL